MRGGVFLDCWWSQQDPFCAIPHSIFSSAGQGQCFLPRVPQEKQRSSLPPGDHAVVSLLHPPLHLPAPVGGLRTSLPDSPPPTLVSRLWDNLPIHPLTSLTLVPQSPAGWPQSPTPVFFQKIHFGV